MAINYGRSEIRIKRQKAGITRSLHSSKKGLRFSDVQSTPPTCTTHDYSGIIGWDKKR